MLAPVDILGPDGLVAARLEHYEARSQQMEMADAVDVAIWDRHPLVVEAGTGVGKSFAYLVPAVLAATSAEDDDSKAKRIAPAYTPETRPTTRSSRFTRPV